MNKNALTEQRRETVIGLLKGMNIKSSAADGFDKDDVYECMQQLCDLYEKNIEELEDAYEAEIEGLKAKYQKYDDNNDLYVSLIMEAKKSSNEIISQAKNEVESILAEGKEQIARQEKELEQVRLGLDSEKQAIIDELNASREAVEAEKAAMNAELEAEKEKVSALKNKYKQQLNSMQEEFAEIKTNILRTSGKIDSLKSKLPDDEEEINWNVSNDVDTVNFPAEDIAVEEPAMPSYVAESVFAAADTETQAVQENVSEAEVEVEIPAETVVTEAELPPVESEAGFTLEDLMADITAAEPEAAPTMEIPAEEVQEQVPEVEEFTLDDIDIELPELVVDEPAAEPVDEVEEISFEGLEELFKEDK
ncbi:MAG: hypothetical protein Q4C46_00510 [Bacillota bacterium]|nr:hypothetical protein [Bacillota bacterium]